MLKRLITSLTALLLAPAPLLAQAPDFITPLGVHPTAQFKMLLKGGGEEIDNDISAAVCTSGAEPMCFAASDETVFVQAFTLKDQQVHAGGKLFLKSVKPKKRHKEFDIEALAATGTTLVAVGSHSWKRNGCKVHRRRQVVFVGDVDPAMVGTETPLAADGISLVPLFKKFTVLDAAFDKALQKGGLNIEGAAMLGRTLYLGFRAPSLPTSQSHVLLMSIDLDGLIGGDYSSAYLHAVAVDGGPGQGIRALEPHGDGLLVLTGDSGVNRTEKDEPECQTPSPDRDNPFKLHVWSPGALSMRHVTDIEVPTGAKAEGLLVVPAPQMGHSALSVAVWFDGEESGAPEIYSWDADIFEKSP